MVRFQPDTWIEGLLRPLVMMDSKPSIYFETMAPDFRFAFFLLFLAVAVLNRGLLGRDLFPQRRLIVGFLVVLYIWAFAIGNGRYFMAGLLLIGPLLVLSSRLLPGTAAFRWMLLAIAIAMQFWVVSDTYLPNRWGLARWTEGPSVELSASPIRERPAVFVTVSSISFSILVPQFHSQSRWANVAGLRDIVPGMREHGPLLDLLAGPLPKYAVLPISAAQAEVNQQPTSLIKRIYGNILEPLGLRLTNETCFVLRSNVAPGPPDSASIVGLLRGFWVCPLSYSSEDRMNVGRAIGPPDRADRAFEAIEKHCPRFFPAGNSSLRSEGFIVRTYASTDFRLIIDPLENVYLKYFRSINATLIGSVDRILLGDFKMACDKPPGRYLFPWQAD